MHGYLSTDVICSKKRTVFRQWSSRKTVSFELLWLLSLKYSPVLAASRDVFRPIERAKNIWWIIKGDISGSLLTASVDSTFCQLCSFCNTAQCIVQRFLQFASRLQLRDTYKLTNKTLRSLRGDYGRHSAFATWRKQEVVGLVSVACSWVHNKLPDWPPGEHSVVSGSC